jgi:hypothetical protein
MRDEQSNGVPEIGGAPSRRDFLRLGGAALGGAALGPGVLAAPFGMRRPRGRAKHVIYLFMYGGPSQVDTFDYKPDLYRYDGKTIDVDTFGRGGKRSKSRVVGPKWRFGRHGECGQWVSELFPNLAQQVDKLAFVHSMYAESPIHGSGLLNMNCGRLISGHPSLGSWVNYGLPSDNPDLPGYVVMLDESGGPINGAKNWTSGYMPASLEGVVLRTVGAPILDLVPPQHLAGDVQRRLLDHVAAENARHQEGRGNPHLAARSEQIELAYRMQAAAPEAVDLAGESDATRALYGLDDETTQAFGKKCLLARRLVERGVRFVQVYSGGGHNDDNWDAHGDLVFNHTRHAGRTDRPIAGLLADLEQRGLLEETLVVWGGEFGRQPTAEYEKGTGRDHNSWGFTMWLAGGGIRPGIAVGETDELGSKAVRDRFHVRNLHATILSCLGLDPNALTFPFNGLDQKLVGVEGAEPIHALFA